MNTVNRIIESDDHIDPQLVFLHRAHSRLILVENGLMSLDEAYGGLISEYCACSRDQRRTA
jgi:hypothetical protein